MGIQVMNDEQLERYLKTQIDKAKVVLESLPESGKTNMNGINLSTEDAIKALIMSARHAMHFKDHFAMGWYSKVLSEIKVSEKASRKKRMAKSG